MLLLYYLKTFLLIIYFDNVNIVIRKNNTRARQTSRHFFNSLRTINFILFGTNYLYNYIGPQVSIFDDVKVNKILK